MSRMLVMRFQMTSVERSHEYTEIPSEASLDSSGGKKPPVDWPANGEITATDVSLKYAEDAPPVLKNLNFTVEAGEKVHPQFN